MKVLVIHDMDGHDRVFEWSWETADALLAGCLLAEEQHTLLSLAGAEALRHLVTTSVACTREEWLDKVEDTIARAFGTCNSPVVILEVTDTLSAEEVKRMLT